MSALIVVALVVLALVGLPLFLVILGITLISQQAVGLQAPVIFVEIFDKITDNPIFMTIPLFAHAGFVLSESKAPTRLVELSRAMLGFMPGGSSLVAIVACALFTAFTGASGVTIIALGGLLLPMLTREKYPERFNLGLLTTGGSLGLLFPPSLPLIIYALIASSIAPVPVDTLFLAAIIPGILLMVALALYGGYVCARHTTRERVPFELARVLRAFKASLFELPIPFIIIIGVFGGFLTLAQAAAVVAVYVSFVELFVYRDLDAPRFLRVTTHSMVLVGAILVIIMAALAMTNYLTDQEVPARMLAVMEQHVTSRLVFLLFLNVFLLIVGCLMDIYSAILVVVPLILPIALAFGVDPIHLGVIFLTNLEIGYSTPPVGINLFISSLRFKRPVIELYHASVPFILLLILCLLVITYVPALSLGLVRAVEGTATAEIAWARRAGSGADGGSGELRWRQRPSDSELDWEAVSQLSTAVPVAASGPLVLRYRPSDPSTLEALERGEHAVECTFELGRGSAQGWRTSARWRATLATLDELAGLSLEPEQISIVPADGPIPALPLSGENWSASTLDIETVVDGRLRGMLRGAILYFPSDDKLPAQIYDLEVAFDCAAELDVLALRPLPAVCDTLLVPDVRLTYHPIDEGDADALEAGTRPVRCIFMLERVRERPWKLRTSFVAEITRLGDISGLTTELSGLAVALDDVAPERLPLAGSEFQLARLAIDSVAGDMVAGRVQALVQSPRGTFDLEVRFSVPAQQK